VGLHIATFYEETSSQKRSGMARVVKESHSFTCHQRVYPCTNGMNYTRFLPSQPKLVLIYRLRRDGRLSWPKHRNGEQTFCLRQLYVTDIAVVTCANCHASLYGQVDVHN